MSSWETISLGSSAKEQPSASCGFGNELQIPKNVKVFAAGAYGGRELPWQIDDSGHQATQIDVAVNWARSPVVLLLGAYEPTVWNIAHTSETKIIGVIASGYHRQALAGLAPHTPALIRTMDERSSCGYFYISESSLESVNLFSKKVLGRAVDTIFTAIDGAVTVGAALAPGARLVSSPETPPESYWDKNAPLAGVPGLVEGLHKGSIRAATLRDIESLTERVDGTRGEERSPNHCIGSGTALKEAALPAGPPEDPEGIEIFVIVKQFTFPAGLYGANSKTFLLPPGVPRPRGNPGHSEVIDLSTGECVTTACIRYSEP